MQLHHLDQDPCFKQLLSRNFIIDADIFTRWRSLRGCIKETVSGDPDQAWSGGGGIKAAGSLRQK